MPLIVVDPGHGGTDSGAVGNGYAEKTLVLEVCLKIRDSLRRCGFQVLMTRETDTLPDPNGSIADDLTYRANLANDAGADFFLAWHVDSVDDPSVNGVASWIHPTTRGTQTETRAERLVDSIAASTGQQNRGVYLGDFAVLRETTMDAVLVESGFITNAQEAQKLADPNFQSKLAEGAVRGLCAIFNMPYVAPATPSQPPTTQPPTVPGSDVAVWPDWAKAAIQKMIDMGIMAGYPDGTWQPGRTVTRAELASALVRLYDNVKNGGAT